MNLQIPQCAFPISCSVPLKKKCAIICSECCIVGYWTSALWYLWIRSISMKFKQIVTFKKSKLEYHLQYFAHYDVTVMELDGVKITSVSIVCSTICSGADQRKHKSSASLAFARGIHQWLVNSPHKQPVTRKVFPFDDDHINVKKLDSESDV